MPVTQSGNESKVPFKMIVFVDNMIKLFEQFTSWITGMTDHESGKAGESMSCSCAVCLLRKRRTVVSHAVENSSRTDSTLSTFSSLVSDASHAMVMGRSLDSLPAEVLTNIIHMLDMDVRQMVSLKFMGRVWNDAAGRAIQMIESLELGNGWYDPSDLKMLTRALKQQRLPNFFRLKNLTICVPNDDSERKVIARILRQASKTLHQLTIQHTIETEYHWLLDRMADLMFPLLKELNVPNSYPEKVPLEQIIARCPGLWKRRVTNKRMLDSTSDSLIELTVDSFSCHFHWSDVQRFTSLQKLMVRNTSIPRSILFDRIMLLRELEVTGCSVCVNDQMIVNLKIDFPVLRELRIEKCECVDHTTCTLTASAVTTLNDMMQLRTVRIYCRNWKVGPSEWRKIRIFMPDGSRRDFIFSKSCRGIIDHWNSSGVVVMSDRWLSIPSIRSYCRDYPSITSLSLNYEKENNLLNAKDLIPLLTSHRQSLTHLSLTGFRVTDDFLDFACSLNLREVYILSGITFSASALIRYLKEKTDNQSLQSLTLAGEAFEFTVKEERVLSELRRKLQYIDVSLVKEVQKDGWIVDSHYINFQSLYVNANPVKVVSNLKKEEKTEFKPMKLLDEGMVLPQSQNQMQSRRVDVNDMILNYSSLTSVSIGEHLFDLNVLLQNCGLTSISVRIPVTDEDMKSISRLEHLKKLTISSHISPLKLRAEGLMHLLNGQSSHCIQKVTILSSFEQKFPRKELDGIRDRIQAINWSRAENKLYVYAAERERDQHGVNCSLLDFSGLYVAREFQE